MAVFFGPTGGFLFGYLAGVFVIGLIAGKGKSSLIKDSVALIVGNMLLYSMGVTWLKLALKISWIKASALGFLPFVPGMIIKIIVAAALIKRLRPLLQSLITDQR